ncbi:GbsR/MarR family transcriptional regulator [Bacillus thermotolerans]|uniref:HTH-type transcriptional regulator n=1 Tax=Bacillus thermotolerans TaxID=1221996 RepID=A0A0F5HXE7_BACTR|nr:transcriptional regulator [Bacillus thermotolerans]KKB38039.1 Betaine operon transcriptional regulator [Bacillus thermotolerans]KKB40700.1 Betaine operon transcriptional regulator [Bacillus thermotolerans]
MGNFSEQSINREIERAETQMFERMADNMKTFGVSPTIGLLFGILHFKEEPMTLDELAEETGMSKTRMSQVMREMLALNIAEKEFVRGSRKEYYKIEGDYIQAFLSIFTANWKEAAMKNAQLARRLSSKLAELRAEYTEAPSEEIQERIDKLEQQLAEWAAYYKWIEQLAGFFESGDVLKYVPVEPKKKTK